MKPSIIVSACLLGENCKYNGGNNRCEAVIRLAGDFELIPVCPECFGGLPIPREPSEITGERVYTKTGEDVTQQFRTGADHTLYIARESNCPAAVLKSRSPSCGFGTVYDGTFSGRLTEGNGVTAQLLADNGIAVFDENGIDKLLRLYAY